MLPIRTILHPTDFSVHSEWAFRLACSLARDHGSRLVVLHVIPPDVHGERIVVYGERGSASIRPRGYYQALEKLCQLRASDLKVSIEQQLEEGEPDAIILRVARESNCDLIVMGTHGRTGLRRLLMGSVAEEVVRKAPCAVLTVKTPFPETAPVRTTQPQEAVQA